MIINYLQTIVIKTTNYSTQIYSLFLHILKKYITFVANWK